MIHDPTSPRTVLLRELATRLLAMPSRPVLRVAIDGVDGAGKTTFANELAETLAPSCRPVLRASVDGFHNPAAVRYQQGRHSPLGFFEDSYDYDTLARVLLEPLSPGGSGRYRRSAFDHRRDASVETEWRTAPENALLIFDGIFLHRPRLRRFWDVSIFLEVPFTVSISRCAQRGDGSPDPDAPSNRRYVEGQRLYLHTCEPQRHATVVIDNSDLARPKIVESSHDWAV